MESIRPGPLPASPLPPPAPVADLQVVGPSRRTDALVASLLALVHGISWLPCVVALLTIVPKFKKIFADFGMKLPWSTELLIDVSDRVHELYPFVPAFFLVLMGLDAWLLYFLLRMSRPFAWVWFVLLILVGAFSLFPIGEALLMPLVDLMEGLSR